MTYVAIKTKIIPPIGEWTNKCKKNRPPAVEVCETYATMVDDIPWYLPLNASSWVPFCNKSNKAIGYFMLNVWSWEDWCNHSLCLFTLSVLQCMKCMLEHVISHSKLCYRGWYFMFQYIFFFSLRLQLWLCCVLHQGNGSDVDSQNNKGGRSCRCWTSSWVSVIYSTFLFHPNCFCSDGTYCVCFV